MKRHIENSGFTLIELSVVILIISLLMSIITVNITTVRQKGRDGARKADLVKIQSALELYRSDKGVYPTAPLYSSNCPSSAPLVSGSTTYLSKLPCDPQGGNYQYCSPSSLIYQVRACLENANDQGKDSPNNPTPSPGCALSTCVGKYSQTLSNP